MKLFNWIKHAYQRITKGYSYRDLWNIDYWFLTVVPKMLQEFSEIKYIGIPCSLVAKIEAEHPEMTSDERDELAVNTWRYTCRQMAYLLSEGLEPKDQVNEYENEYWGWDDIKKERKYGFTKDEDGEFTFTTNQDPEIAEKYHKRSMEIEKYREEQLQKGLKMFSENLETLWW